jgi:hypothetical protein
MNATFSIGLPAFIRGALVPSPGLGFKGLAGIIHVLISAMTLFEF